MKNSDPDVDDPIDDYVEGSDGDDSVLASLYENKDNGDDTP